MTATKIPALWFDRKGCGPSDLAIRLHPMPSEKNGAIPATLGLRIESAGTHAIIHGAADSLVESGFMLYRDQVEQLRDALDAWLVLEAAADAEVDQQIRAAGGDPDAIGERGVSLASELLAKLDRGAL